MVSSLNSAQTARDPFEQNVIIKRFTVNFNDAGIATGVVRGVVPQGAILIGTDVLLNVTFNANSTNIFTVGSNSTQLDNVVADANVTEGTAGLYQDIKPTGTALGVLTADLPLTAKYAQTGGTVATQGQAVVIVKYVTGGGVSGGIGVDN
jgi:hypothetical protein